jgi:SAM-dependent methyltransferase
MWDQIAIKSMVKGMLTFVPGWQWVRRREGGGAGSARYCYSVWLRHRILAAKCGFISQPEAVAELGPGDSIGAGLAALLSGCKAYLALDIVPFTTLEKNLKVFDELVELFRQRAPIPDDAEFPNLYPRLDDYGFPVDIFSGDHLKEALEEHRLRLIREALLTGDVQTKRMVDIRYVAPWNSKNIIETNSVDMIFSQAVMEHVDDLRTSYAVMHQWLKRGGIISHEIDFKCHKTAYYWNGHWTYTDLIWKIIRGRRPYFLNRQTCGRHLDLIKHAGFEIAYVKREEKAQSIRRTDLCRELKNTTDDDLITASAYIVASKKERHGER